MNVHTPPKRTAARVESNLGEAPIDPRILARRSEVRRRATRVRRWVLAGLLGMISALVLAGLLLESPLFSVRHVVVNGVGPGRAAQVVAQAGFKSHPTLIGLNPAADAAAVASLPWVEKAKVQRRWPDTVVVEVSVRVPVAYLRSASKNSGYPLVDSSGRVVAFSAHPPVALPELKGDVSAAPLGKWLGGHGEVGANVAGSLPAIVRGKVLNIWTTKQADVVFKMAAGPLVILGNSGQLSAKMSALQTLDASVPFKKVKYIDLTVPDVPTLTGG